MLTSREVFGFGSLFALKKLYIWSLTYAQAASLPVNSSARTRLFVHLALYLLSGGLYACLLYATPREAYGQLLLLFLGLFAVYAWRVFPALTGEERPQEERPREEGRLWRLMLLAAVGFRVLALFSMPELSDDYARFVWDGKLLVAGESPFLQLPSEYMDQPARAQALGLTPELYQALNSPHYFTIYPPVNQAVFWLGVSLSPDSTYGAVLWMKLMLLLAELGTLWLLLRLLAIWKYPKEWVALYALNPLVVVELVGNLHFEALMIFFLLASVYLFEQTRWRWAALPFVGAICSKLLPIMLLPLLLRRLGWRRALGFGGLVAGGTLLCFLSVLDVETFAHLLDSVSLYFQKFEFNASIYYLVRWVGFQVKGYNIIQTAGTYLAAITVLGILLLTVLERRPRWPSLPAAMLGAFTIYFALASIVHPWYITTLVALATLSPWRYPVIWSALLPLTYVTYRDDTYTELLGLVAVEYLLVLAWMMWEGKKRLDLQKKRTNDPPHPLMNTDNP